MSILRMQSKKHNVDTIKLIYIQIYFFPICKIDFLAGLYHWKNAGILLGFSKHTCLESPVLGECLPESLASLTGAQQGYDDLSVGHCRNPLLIKISNPIKFGSADQFTFIKWKKNDISKMHFLRDWILISIWPTNTAITPCRL